MFDIDLTTINRPFAKEDYDETGHFYLTDEGKRYVSITTLFKILDPFEEKPAWRGWIEYIRRQQNLEWEDAVEKSKEISKNSTDVGTEMHRLAECYLNKESTMCYEKSKFEKDPFELFTVLKKWLDDNIAIVHATECKMYSDDLEIAGTVDLVATLKTGEKVIIDFKNSRKPKTHAKMEESHYYEQICGYQKMWRFCTGENIKTGIVLVVSWDNKVKPYRINISDYDHSLYQWIAKFDEYKCLNN